MRIRRQLAIATKEVTFAQFQEFLKDNDQFNTAWRRASLREVHFPSPGGPWVSPNWALVASYCNWLSEREGVPENQRCYRLNEAGLIAEGMNIPGERAGTHWLPFAHRGREKLGNMPAAPGRSPAVITGCGAKLWGTTPRSKGPGPRLDRRELPAERPGHVRHAGECL